MDGAGVIQVPGVRQVVVTFDFDGTLCTEEGRPVEAVINCLRRYAKCRVVYIVTSRNAHHEEPEWYQVYQPGRVIVRDFIKAHKLPVRGVFFTCHELKAGTLVSLGSRLHVDDDPLERMYAEIAGVKCMTPGEV